MTSVVISQPMLFPWPGFFEQMKLADVYLFLDDVQFSKGSFTNRIQIKLGNDVKWMTVPLVNKGSFQTISDLDSPSRQWRQGHLDLLAQAFRDAPYRDDALDIVREVYRIDGLCDLLIASIEGPAQYLGIAQTSPRLRTSSMHSTGKSWQRVLDLVRLSGGDRYITGHGARAYLDHEAFEAAGVTVEYMNYSKTPWPQAGDSFTPYVSILDLIANTGQQAYTYLHPATAGWRQFTAAEDVSDA